MRFTKRFIGEFRESQTNWPETSLRELRYFFSLCQVLSSGEWQTSLIIHVNLPTFVGFDRQTSCQNLLCCQNLFLWWRNVGIISPLLSPYWIRISSGNFISNFLQFGVKFQLRLQSKNTKLFLWTILNLKGEGRATSLLYCLQLTHYLHLSWTKKHSQIEKYI